MMLRFDRAGVLYQVSRFLAQRLGYRPEEMAGRRCCDFLVAENAYAAEAEYLSQLFRDGRLHDAVCQFRRADGTTMDTLLTAVAQTDAAGHFVQGLAVVFDNSEARRAMSLLQQRQRAESVGRLVTGVAHDFNNALSVIQGRLELLQEAPPGADRDLHLAEALRATRRAATMARQLLAIGQEGCTRPVNMDLNEAVTAISATLARLMPETIDIDTATTGRPWPVRLDRLQLETAILTLADCARASMPGGGTLTIETANIRVRERQESPGQETLLPGRYVMLAMTDSGMGITRERLERIVDARLAPWESGDPAAIGFGIVQDFVRQSGGALRVHSEVGFGTTYKLYFPASGMAQATDSYREELEDDTFNARAGTQILVVEDQDDVRRVLVAQLRAEGYRVAEAANGDFALTLLENGFHPAILLTDVVMPGRLQGPTLANAARNLVPTIKVMFLSGYTFDADNAEARPDVFLLKPVSRKALVAAVTDLID